MAVPEVGLGTDAAWARTRQWGGIDWSKRTDLFEAKGLAEKTVGKAQRKIVRLERASKPHSRPSRL